MRGRLIALGGVVLMLFWLAQPALAQDDIDGKVQKLTSFIGLMADEYGKAVADGQVRSPDEYAEAEEFYEESEALFNELRPALAAQNPAAADTITANMAQFEQIISSKGDPQTLHTLAETTEELVRDSFGVAEATAVVTFPAIEHELDEIVAKAEVGDYAAADHARLEAYALYEQVESRLRFTAPDLAHEIEERFWQGEAGSPGLAVLVANRAPAAEIKELVEGMEPDLAEAVERAGATSNSWIAAFTSAGLILREGLEAVLVIAALLGYLRASGNKGLQWHIYAGVVAALVATALTWVAASTIITITPAARELIEGITSLLAVVVLFYVTNWIFHKVYVTDWVTFARSQVQQALAGGNIWLLAGLGFMVVYREGFETVLFYQALLFEAQPLPVLWGFLAGFAIVIAVGVAVLALGRRLPLKPFFTATAALLLLLAVMLAGSGVRLLQEGGVASVTPLTWVPDALWLQEALGIFPTVETVAAQLLVLLALAASYFYAKTQRRAVAQTA